MASMAISNFVRCGRLSRMVQENWTTYLAGSVEFDGVSFVGDHDETTGK